MEEKSLFEWKIGKKRFFGKYGWKVFLLWKIWKISIFLVEYMEKNICYLLRWWLLPWAELGAEQPSRPAHWPPARKILENISEEQYDTYIGKKSIRNLYQYYLNNKTHGGGGGSHPADMRLGSGIGNEIVKTLRHSKIHPLSSEKVTKSTGKTNLETIKSKLLKSV